MNDPASFRDPAGVVFYENGMVKRRINACYMPQYRKLIGSGLYRELVAAGGCWSLTENCRKRAARRSW